MKEFRVKYIYQECSSLEEESFRIRQFRKYGFYLCSCGQSTNIDGTKKHYIIVADTKIRHSSAIELHLGVRK